MTKLSVNINKFATIRNARGGNNPNLVQVAIDCQNFGADGITVHPRPDERHIRYADVFELKQIITTEFNIEGNPLEDKFVQLVLDSKPTQVTLVPDSLTQITSNHGWDTLKNHQFLSDMIKVFKKEGIRTSIFVDANLDIVNLKFGNNYSGIRAELLESALNNVSQSFFELAGDKLYVNLMVNPLNVENSYSGLYSATNGEE